MSNPVSFSPLDRRSVKIGAQATYDLANSHVAFQNALLEGISGKPCVGNPSMSIAPHDHAVSGVALPRGCLFSLDYGGLSQADFHTTAGSGFERFWDWKPNFSAFVTPEVDSTVLREAGSGYVYLYGNLLIKTDGYDFDIRIKNEITGTYSTTKTAASATQIQQVVFTDIPVVGGVWNAFNLEVDGGGGGRSLYLISLHLVEIRSRSQPKSAGTSVFSTL